MRRENWTRTQPVAYCLEQRADEGIENMAHSSDVTLFTTCDEQEGCRKCGADRDNPDDDLCAPCRYYAAGCGERRDDGP